jgi:hypothetical protein
MKSLRTLILAGVILGSGCVLSLNPLYTDADLTMDPSLVGTWVDNETGETWIFSNCEKFKYTLLHSDPDGRKGEYEARLVKIEDKLFLDVLPVKPRFVQNDLYRDRFIATHTFVHIVRKDSTVEISYMDPRWLEDYLSENPDAIRHEKVGGDVVLSSSPKETQKFITESINLRGAFSEPSVLVRRRSRLANFKSVGGN